MNDVRVETDASVKNGKTSFGYVIYTKQGSSYEKVRTGSEIIEEDIDSQRAEELAVIRGLSEAYNYYSEGTIAIMTDSKNIIDSIMHKNRFSSDSDVHQSFSRVTSKFDNVMVKWIPSGENCGAHNACRDIMKEKTV